MSKQQNDSLRDGSGDDKPFSRTQIQTMVILFVQTIIERKQLHENV